MSHRRASLRKWIAILIFAALFVYLIGNNSVPLWDRDEPRYAQTSRQMLQSGDWIVPRFLDEVRTAKPVFIYWCQAGAMKLFGDNAFAARLPSAIAMTLTLIVLALWLPRAIGPRRTVWALLVFCSSGMVIAAAKMCLTDSVQLLFIVLAQICLYAIWQGRASWKTWLIMGVAIGLAGLTKGPVVLGVMATTAVALLAIRMIENLFHRRAIVRSAAERADQTAADQKAGESLDYEPAAIIQTPPAPSLRVRRIFSPMILIAIVIAAAICLPWLMLIHHREPSFLPRILGHDVIERMKSGLEGHKGPPGYYVVTIWGTFFPWSILLPAAIVYAWRHRGNSLIRFSLAGVIGPWVMFEMIRTKLPHYLLPVFPGLAILTARMIAAYAKRGRIELRNSIAVRVVGGWSIVVALGCLVPLAVTWRHRESTMMSLIGLMLAVTIAAVGVEYARSVYVSFRAGKPTYGVLLMGIGMLILTALLYGGWLPTVKAIRISPQIAAVLRDERATNVGSVVMIDYKEPSLAFYQGGTIREESNNRFFIETDPILWPRYIVMTRSIFDALPPDRRDRLERITSVDGWWYANKGKQAEVLVMRRR